MLEFGHMPELILVLVLGLIIFGPGKLPEIGSALGRGIREFKKATTDIEDQPHRSPTQTPDPQMQLPITTDRIASETLPERMAPEQRA